MALAALLWDKKNCARALIYEVHQPISREYCTLQREKGVPLDVEGRFAGWSRRIEEDDWLNDLEKYCKACNDSPLFVMPRKVSYATQLMWLCQPVAISGHTSKLYKKTKMTTTTFTRMIVVTIWFYMGKCVHNRLRSTRLTFLIKFSGHDKRLYWFALPCERFFHNESINNFDSCWFRWHVRYSSQTPIYIYI